MRITLTEQDGASDVPVAGFGEEVFGLDGAQPSLGHEATDSSRGASQAPIGEFDRQMAVAVASAVAPEDGLDEFTKMHVGDLSHGGGGGVVEAAAGFLEDRAHLANTAAGLLRDELDHRPAPGWGLVPRMTAVFFKMSFSILSWAWSRRNRRAR